MPNYTVQQGDCVTSIANQYGLLWTTIWKHPNNGQLRQLRKDPNVLYPGDQLFVPDLEVKQVDRPTDQRHTFVKIGAPAKLKIRLLDQDQPRAGVAYQLEIDGALKSGVTDSGGYIQQPLPPGAERGKLTVGAGSTRDVYEIQFGSLDPFDTDTGVRGRLVNLGFGGDDMKEAIMAFQQKEGIPVTGEADAATQSRLQTRHGQ
jgi:peptidoglycan hydrolase-like protein with peptidoglycan-binding domain